MENRIIALQGKGSSGKSSTIMILHDVLLENRYHELPGLYKTYGVDFLNVYTDDNVKIGITSSGDSYKTLMSRFKHLMKSNCDVYVCACRTFDRKHPGTVAAVNSFPNYPPLFIEKTVLPKTATKVQQMKVNTDDAIRIFSAICKLY